MKILTWTLKMKYFSHVFAIVRKQNVGEFLNAETLRKSWELVSLAALKKWLGGTLVMLGLLVLFCFLACNFQLQQQLNPSLKNTLMFRSQRNQKKKKKKKKLLRYCSDHVILFYKFACNYLMWGQQNDYLSTVATGSTGLTGICWKPKDSRARL